MNLLELKTSKEVNARIRELKLSLIDFLKKENPEDYIIKCFTDSALCRKRQDVIAMLLCQQTNFKANKDIFLNSQDSEDFFCSIFSSDICENVIQEIEEDNDVFEDMGDILEYYDYELESLFGQPIFNNVTGEFVVSWNTRDEYFDNFEVGDIYYFTEFGCYRYEILYNYLTNKEPKLLKNIISNILKGCE